MNSTADRLAQRFAAELGDDSVAADSAQLDSRKVDGQLPDLLCRPANEAQLSVALRICAEHEATVIPWGGGTAIALGNAPRHIDVVISTERLARIIDHDHANLTVSAESGVVLARLQGEIANEHQFAPLEAPFSDCATIGGIIAANLNGPRRSYYGSVRDLVIGIRVVLIGGEKIKAGGKVVKNVAGYDMISLRKPPFFLLADQTIQRPNDLAGKRIGVDRIGSLQHLVARLMLKQKGTDPEKVIFTQTGSVSNTVSSLAQGAVSAAILSGPHNVIMAQKGFRQIGAADELPMHFPTSGLVVNETRLKTDAPRIKNVIRVMLDAATFCRKERAWVVNYIKDRWKVDGKTAETVYDQWLSILTPDGKISVKDMQEYFDLAYNQKQIPAPINVAAVTDYSLLEQVLAGK